MVSIIGLAIPARLRSGSRYLFNADWSLARSPATMATFRVPPTSFAPLAQATRVLRIDAWSGPVHHR